MRPGAQTLAHYTVSGEQNWTVFKCGMWQPFRTMTDSERVACVHCGAETQLYVSGSPVCVDCADAHDGEAKPQDSGWLPQSE